MLVVTFPATCSWLHIAHEHSKAFVSLDLVVTVESNPCFTRPMRRGNYRQQPRRYYERNGGGSG